MLLWASAVVAASSVMVWCAAWAAMRLPRVTLAVAIVVGVVAFLAGLRMTGGLSYPVSDLFILCAATAAAILLAGLASSWNALSALFIVAAIADAISTFAGPTRYLLSATGGRLVQYLSVTAPYGGHLVAVVGLTDLAFLGAAWLAFNRLQARLLLAVLPLMGLEAAVAIAVGPLQRPLPALPFLAAGVLVARWVGRPSPGQQ